MISKVYCRKFASTKSEYRSGTRTEFVFGGGFSAAHDGFPFWRRDSSRLGSYQKSIAASLVFCSLDGRCREWQHRSRNLKASIDMRLAQNSFLAWRTLGCAYCVPHHVARLLPPSFVPHTFSCTSVGSPSGASAFFRRYGDGSSTAPYRADLLALPESSVRGIPVQDLERSEDSEFLVGFKGRSF